MNIEFKNIKELYDRVYPALKSKKKELKLNNFDYIKEEDIWNYLVKNKWKKSNGLELSDIVNDILNTDNFEIDKYVKSEMKKINRDIDLDF